MRKYLYAVLGLILLLAFAFPVLAKTSDDENKDDKGPLTKITFIHWKKGFAKPPNAGKPDKNRNSCYSYLSNGAKWKTTEPYYVKPDNQDGLEDSFVKEAVDLGVAEWEKYGGDGIFGEGEISYLYDYNNGDKDEKNTASFGSYPNSGVIAIANVWGYFGGRPSTRELIEWDILFNTNGDWNWGDATVSAGFMDLQNIATHELGHSAGMADLYETSCTLETMYGYSGEGETSKRDLNTGDIAGIEALY